MLEVKTVLSHDPTIVPMDARILAVWIFSIHARTSLFTAGSGEYAVVVSQDGRAEGCLMVEFCLRSASMMALFWRSCARRYSRLLRAREVAEREGLHVLGP